MKDKKDTDITTADRILVALVKKYGSGGKLLLTGEELTDHDSLYPEVEALLDLLGPEGSEIVALNITLTATPTKFKKGEVMRVIED